MKNRTNWIHTVDYDTYDISDIVGIHKCLMKNADVK